MHAGFKTALNIHQSA